MGCCREERREKRYNVRRVYDSGDHYGIEGEDMWM